MRIGPYEVVAKAGEGAMGVVYRARDPGLGRDVALKVMSAGGGDAGRFATETQALARLRHENVVTVHAAGVENGAPFLAMEWVDGTTLREHLRRNGPLPDAEARRVVGGVARALEYAHARGVVHRDVKPENVLLASDGRVLLADFGLARLLGRETRVTVTGEVLGTPAYAAPEQASGEVAEVGPATDVWALGVLLFEVLTGETPFPRSSMVATLQAILTQAPPTARSRRPGVDRRLDAVVRRCLQKTPADRGTAGDVVVAVAAAGTRPTSGRGGLPVVLLAIAAVAVVAGVVAGLTLAPRDAAATGVAPEPSAGPRLVLTEPRPGQETGTRVLVSGTLEPPVAGARVRVGDVEGRVSARDGRFAVEVDLEPGERTLEAWVVHDERPVAGPARVTVLAVPDALRHLTAAERPPLPLPPGLVPEPGSPPRWTCARDGSVLTWVQPGRFARQIHGADRSVEVPRGVFLAAREVTCGQVREFVRATGRRHPLVDPGLPEDAPAALDWFDAQEYCRWAGLRLPTELEWGLGYTRLRFPGEGQEWLQDWSTPSPPGERPTAGDAPAPLRRALATRAGGAPLAEATRRGLRPGVPQHLLEPEEREQVGLTRFRVALDPDGAACGIPAPRWSVEAFDFVREDLRQTPPGPATSLETLRTRARHRIQVELPHLDLRFGEHGPGDLLCTPVDPAFPRDWFLVVATTRVELPAGRWGIYVRTDDGVRVRRDGALLIDAWVHRYDGVNTATFTLEARSVVELTVEYHENHGGATLTAALYPD